MRAERGRGAALRRAAGRSPLAAALVSWFLPCCRDVNRDIFHVKFKSGFQVVVATRFHDTSAETSEVRGFVICSCHSLSNI